MVAEHLLVTVVSFICLFLLIIKGFINHGGGKVLGLVFNVDIDVGVVLSGVFVLLIVFFGGMRASLTDALQSVVMLVSTIILAIFSVKICGGISNTLETLWKIDKSLLNPLVMVIHGHVFVICIWVDY